MWGWGGWGGERGGGCVWVVGFEGGGGNVVGGLWACVAFFLLLFSFFLFNLLIKTTLIPSPSACNMSLDTTRYPCRLQLQLPANGALILSEHTLIAEKLTNTNNRNPSVILATQAVELTETLSRTKKTQRILKRMEAETVLERYIAWTNCRTDD